MGCQQVKDKRELIRVVRDPDGQVSLDFTGRKAGRGAYICPREECLNKAIKTRAIERSLEVQIDVALYETMRSELKNE